MSRPLVLLDAASLYFRAFFSSPDSMVAPDGTQVNAVRGFTDMVARLIQDRRASRLVACLDLDWRPQFRVDAIPSYKAHRVAEEGEHGLAGTEDSGEEVPDTLSPQVPIILEVLDAAGIATAGAEGFEADDVLATLACQEQRDPVEVVSGDRDLFQVVRDEPTSVKVFYVGRGLAKAELIGTAELAAKYALPHRPDGAAYATLAALRGDPSDGLPGVPGIGDKTAAGLIHEIGLLEDLIVAMDDPASKLSPAARRKLLAARDYLAVAPRVVNVVTDAPVQLDRPDVLDPKAFDGPRLAELQETWGLGTSIDRLAAALTRAQK